MPWPIVSVQPFRVPTSPPALSLTRKVQSPAIPVPSKSGAYVWSMSFAEPPVRLCSVWDVPSGAMRSITRSPRYVCEMSTVTETDVAVPDRSTVMASCMVLRSAMRSAGSLVCVNCPEPLPPPVLSGDSAKSPASTPVTSSLNVTSNTKVDSEVSSPDGSLLSIDASVGAVLSVIVVLTVYV